MPNRSHHKGPTKEEGFQFAAHSGKQFWQRRSTLQQALHGAQFWHPQVLQWMCLYVVQPFCAKHFANFDI
jgi:hypothetical protein